MTRNLVRAAWAVALVVSFAALVGCSEKKDDSGAPAKGGGGDPKPDPNTPPDTEPGALGEPKHKMTAAEFVAEYTKNERGANAKFAGSVVELSGTATETAGVELTDLGTPAGKPGERKAAFVIGEPGAKRIETVVVRGLPLGVIGQVFKGQTVTVKGRVAKHDSLQPVELSHAEVVKTSTAEFNPLSIEKLANSPGEFLTLPTTGGRTPSVTGTVAEMGKEGTGDFVDLESAGKKVRCWLAPGVADAFGESLAKGKKVTLAGTPKLEKADVRWWIELRDCVPVSATPKTGD